MCELAFGSNGERFEPPASAAFWRVRRLRTGGRGVPEVVFAESGLPLVLPIETGIDEFRQLVNDAPGKYRLDPIDDSQEVCEGAVAAYVCLMERKAKPTHVHSKEAYSGGNDRLLFELVRTNAEMVRTMTERFAGVMESAATLLRAADGAGLPQREPAPPPAQLALALRNAEAITDDSEEDAEEHAQLAQVLQTVAEKAMPLLSHTINTKLLGLTPDQSIALMGGGAAASQQAQQEPEATTAAPQPAAPGSKVDFMAHLMAIEQLLAPNEAQLARRAIGQMSPAVLAAWRERILAMCPEDAAVAVREAIGALGNEQADSAKKREAA